MNIDNYPMDIPAKSLVYCLKFVPKLQACSLVNHRWRGAAVGVTAHRLNELARGVYQRLSPSDRPNRELFEAILAKNGEAQSFNEIRVNDKEIKNLFLSHFRLLPLEESANAARLMERLPKNRFFNSDKISLESIIKACHNELAAIDQIHDIEKEARRAEVLFSAALDLNELQIPQATEELEKLFYYYPSIGSDQMSSRSIWHIKSTISILSQKFLGLGNLEKAVHYAIQARGSYPFKFIPELFAELFQKEREELAISFASQVKGNSQQHAFFELALHFFRKGLFEEGSNFAKKVDLPEFKKQVEEEMKRYLPPPFLE